MVNRYRIHGDNIIECERIAALIIKETHPERVNILLMSPSTIVYNLDFIYYEDRFCWQLELLPGFNKAGRSRWESNIFKGLRNSGSFLDETPDAIVTRIEDRMETILFAIEFCSALQAGNQAWQRSGRAFSTGRTGCPYLYIVDFVKYELDPITRERKALRFPNPAVPYSYINFSQTSNNFVAQVYIRSEEFNKTGDRLLYGFDENDFAEKELSQYVVKKMCGLDTTEEERRILHKNLNVVMFLANSSRSATNFTPKQWRQLYSDRHGIIPFSIENSKFNFHKTITAKGHHGKTQLFLDLVDDLSVGLASRDLPFGIIPTENRKEFAVKLKKLYPTYPISILSKISSSQSDLILCIVKGFKPRGDDNRPDRGILPLATMLTSTKAEIITYIYGPIIGNNLEALIHSPKRLAASNGFWKSILSLSDYVALDAPVIAGKHTDVETLIDTSELKYLYTSQNLKRNELMQDAFSSVPQSFHEDDVDTGIHYLFSHLLRQECFEGMCNPPGGDWSGLSVLYGNYEMRWLSLPRVSEEVNGKRPDHVLELFGVFERPLLLSIESKEKAWNLETNVGNGLINYIQSLMTFVPNVERLVNPHFKDWQRSKTRVNFYDFEVISAAAYLRQYQQPQDIIFNKSKCDMLFVMEPISEGWNIEIITNTASSRVLKSFIRDKIFESESNNIRII